MHGFYVDFKHLLERQVADIWALTEGKHHPIGLALFVQMWSAWLLAFSQIFAPYIHLSSITVMVILSWPVAFYLMHLEHEGMSCGRESCLILSALAFACILLLSKTQAWQAATTIPPWHSLSLLLRHVLCGQSRNPAWPVRAFPWPNRPSSKEGVWF